MSHLLKLIFNIRCLFPHPWKIYFVEGNELSFFLKRRVVGLQFMVEGMKVLDRIARRLSRDIQEVNEKACPLHMSKKGQSETCSFRGAFDESWNIGHHKGPVFLSLHHSKIGDKGGEGIVCDLG